MKKTLRLLALVLLPLLLLFGSFLFREWEAPVLGRAVLARAAALGGVELEVTGVWFQVFRGMRLEKVRVRMESPGGVLEAEMETLALKHRLGPLFSGRVEIDELRLVRPVLRLLPPAAGSPVAGPEPSGSSGGRGSEATAGSAGEGPDAVGEDAGLALSIARITIEEGSIHVVSAEEGVAPTRLEGVDVELRELSLDPAAPSAVVGLSGSGRLEAVTVDAEPLVASDLEADLSIGGGKVTLSHLELEAREGPFAAEALVLDLSREPWLFEVRSGRMAPIALAELLGASGGGFGPAELGVEVKGDAETLGLDGGGRVTVAEGTLPRIPLLAALEALLGSTAISGSPYEAFEVPFRLTGTRLDLERSEIRTPDLRIALDGGADLAGTVDLKATLRFPRDGFDVEEIPDEVLDLLTDAEGFVNLHAALVGPMDAPRASLDRSAWERTTRDAVRREVRRGLEKEAGKLLGRLLGGDDEEDGEGGGG